ncbi:hypothetical protein KUTeg_004783 [Tegillarca granosa]|uniref:WD repeat-containing protein 54 beta-propeller domain-containing protein n=1 Tax=Tegillarca granosa TaxID=220873 RepID=A0ABQ9FHX0_TEGGR|nr:hypothetical protein KUTeg_004783 [Tegillarca granosa]
MEHLFYLGKVNVLTFLRKNYSKLFIKMYRSEKPIPLKGSASALSNNLSVLLTEEKKSLNYAVVHKSVVNIVSAATDGSTVTNRHVVCKEPTATQQTTPMIIQAKWVTIPCRTVLVLTSLKGIQVFESDGTALIYWHSLGDVHSPDSYDQSNFGRGITGVGDSFLCVVGGFGNGQLKVYCAKTGKLGAVVNAHARWINALDIAPDTGLVVSVSDDTFVKIWQLKKESPPEIEHKYQESVSDLQLVGAQFVHSGGRGFCVTGYDNTSVYFFVQN